MIARLVSLAFGSRRAPRTPRAPKLGDEPSGSPRVVYITSHVGPHPVHGALVRGVGAAIGRLDEKLRWVDVPAPKWKHYLSWLVNGWSFRNRDRYDLFIVEGFQVPVVLMKWMRRLAPGQKVVCHHTAEQLYFLSVGFYSKSTAFAMRRLLAGFDAHICVGLEQTRLLREQLGPRARAPIYTVYCTHVSAKKFERFGRIEPRLDSERILFVGNVYGSWRIFYKGVDLLLEAFHLALSNNPRLRLTLIGLSPADLEGLTRGLPTETRERIDRISFADDLAPHFAAHALFLLPGRGDAFPTVVLEAMAAGLVPMVSVATGNKEVVEGISPDLVAPLDAATLAARLGWYFSLPSEERHRLSARARELASGFTEARGVENFRQAIRQIYADTKG